MGENMMNKAADCKTEEELEALVAEEGMALSDDMLESVAGGVFGYDPRKPCPDKKDDPKDIWM